MWNRLIETPIRKINGVEDTLLIRGRHIPKKTKIQPLKEI